MDFVSPDEGNPDGGNPDGGNPDGGIWEAGITTCSWRSAWHEPYCTPRRMFFPQASGGIDSTEAALGEVAGAVGRDGLQASRMGGDPPGSLA